MKSVTRQPAREDIFWLLGTMVCVIAPHVQRVPIWILVSFGLLALWRVLADLRYLAYPNKEHAVLNGVKYLLAITLFLGVYVSYGYSVRHEAGIALLIVLLALKLIEIASHRDFYLACFICYFLIVTSFFASQTVVTALYVLLNVMLITACLLRLHDVNQRLSTLRSLYIAGTILVQSIPILLVAFYLFPRLPGPLWNSQEQSGSTGLGDQMSPGNISNLSLSDKLAFRVTFDGPTPPREQLYWRAVVLWETDGRTWNPGPMHEDSTIAILPEGRRYNYVVTLEPHQQDRLVLLDMPLNAPSATHMSSDFQVFNRKPIVERKRYTATSHTSYYAPLGHATERQQGTQLPNGAHPKSVALARQWRSQSASPKEVIQKALTYFREQPFVYTLQPPLLRGDTVDEFLFKTQRGFCEHYSSAFTILMRAADIPTRVVLGYQGGEYNPVGEYLVVLQRDAHAWVEVWLEEDGWVRVDPTAAVAPQRIERGMGHMAAGQFADLFADMDKNSSLSRWLASLRHSLDAMTHGWNQWVLNYGSDRQSKLLSKFGLNNVSMTSLTIGFVLAVCLTALLVALWVYKTRSPTLDVPQTLYERFCHKVAKIGFIRRPHEGPQDYARRVSTVRPDLKKPVEAITRAYIMARYGGRREQITILEQRVKAFRASRRRPPTSTSAQDTDQSFSELSEQLN